MAGGWIKLHRSILDWRWYGDQNTRIVFIHLLLTANHKDKAWRNITIKRGQRAVSYSQLGEELGLTARQARTAVCNLISTGELSRIGSGRYPIITICNYGKYQAKESDDESCEADELSDKCHEDVTKDVTKMSTTKEYKKERSKEDKNTTPPTPSPEIPYEEIVKAYNDSCTLMPKANRITAARRRSMKARWNDYGKGELQPFVALFRRASQSAFLNGENDRGWYADFDWLLNESNLTKVLEGKYDRAIRASPGKPVTQQEENSRILRRMYEDAIREEQANGDNEGSDDPTLKPDKRGLSEQQVPDNRQPGEFVGSLPRAL